MWMLLCFLLVKIGKLEGFYDQSQFQVKRSSNELNVCCSQVDKSNPGLYISRSFVCLIVWACDKQSRSPGAQQSTEVGYVFYPWALMAQSVQPSLLNKNCMSNLPLKASDTWFQRFLLTIEEVKGRNRPCSRQRNTHWFTLPSTSILDYINKAKARIVVLPQMPYSNAEEFETRHLLIAFDNYRCIS